MMGISMGDEACGFLTLSETAYFLRLHKMTLYKLMRQKKSVPPYVKIGGDYRFFKSRLDSWIKEQIDA